MTVRLSAILASLAAAATLVLIAPGPAQAETQGSFYWLKHEGGLRSLLEPDEGRCWTTDDAVFGHNDTNRTIILFSADDCQGRLVQSLPPQTWTAEHQEVRFESVYVVP
ncbi:hypothetical protein DP939_16085 [Spongiactinospora rosea]|uniref:Secreted protein n=1 Tax=Spongiactinospora rosea TaxID=2248750 RepID=A0A366M1X2_9ACTN|nr:hypothetical protein [Spongiactinospora rosea]RBQ19432.1 hypothetical protein DP939_16085 [Spongiactinospora rosea]